MGNIFKCFVYPEIWGLMWRGQKFLEEEQCYYWSDFCDISFTSPFCFVFSSMKHGSSVFHTTTNWIHNLL